MRRRNSASDRAPRLRRRPSSARRPRSLKKKIEEEDFIANGDLGRAVKDALRVCKWKTRVAFLIILISLASYQGMSFRLADHAFVDASQIDASDSNPEPDTSARV